MTTLSQEIHPPMWRSPSTIRWDFSRLSQKRMMHVLLVVYILFAILPSGKSQLLLTNFPETWDVPQVVHARVDLAPYQINSSQVEIIYSLKSEGVNIPFHLESCGCALTYPEGEYGPGDPYTSVSPAKLADLSFSFVCPIKGPHPGGDAVASGVLWKCKTTIPSSSDPQKATFLTAESLITTHQTIRALAHQWLVPNLPSLAHEFMWSRYNGVADNPIALAITYTVSRSTLYGSITSAIMEHPFLKRRSDAQTGEGPLRTIYNIMPDENDTITANCFSVSNEQQATGAAKFPPTGGYASITFPQGSQPCICQFKVYYQPDHLDVFLGDAEMPTHLKWDGDGSSLGMTLKTPPTIPVKMYPGPTPQPVHIWTSPHHLRQDNRLEFGIAMTDHVIQLDGTIKRQFVDPSSVFSSILSLYPTSSSDSIVTLNCYKHGQDRETNYRRQEFRLVSGLEVALENIDFYGFGLTCYANVDVQPSMQEIDSTLLSVKLKGASQALPITIYDVTQRPILIRYPLPNQIVGHAPLTTIPIYNTSVDPAMVPPAPPIPMQLVEDGGSFFLQTDLRVHYLPHVPTDASKDLMFLHLLLADYQDFRRPDLEFSTATVTITSRGYLANTYNANLNHAFEMFWKNRIPHGAQFFNGQHLPFPAIVIPIKTVFDSSQPLRFQLKIAISKRIDQSVIVYPMLVPNYISQLGVFMPSFAHITPYAAPEPLAQSYTYRCVNWSQLLTTYSLGKSVILDETNSSPCPSYISNDTQQIDTSNTNMWRRVQFQGLSDSISRDYTPLCMYQLSAVCVAPSTSTPGAFIPLPIEDCPSLLGSRHAVPCDLEELDPSRWNFRLSNPMLLYVPENHQLALRWDYQGDPRLTISVQVGMFSAGQSDVAYVQVASAIPAYLAPHTLRIHSQSLLVNMPLLHQIGTDVPEIMSVKISLNGIPGQISVATIGYPPLQGDLGDCSQQRNQMVDPVTRLCTCQPGFTPNVPIGLANPFILPTKFECNLTAQCADGTQWDPMAGACVCPDNGSFDEHCNPIPPDDAAQCDHIPPGTPAPFRTSSCGYGVSTDNSCKECKCFKAWALDSTTNKCDHCILKDFCIQDNTAPITNLPEYCWVGRCLCNNGFYGDRCEHRVVYGTLQYVSPITEEQTETFSSPDTLHILTRKQIRGFDSRVAGNVRASLGDTPVSTFVHQATQSLSEDGQHIITSLVVGLGRSQPLSQSSQQLHMRDDKSNTHNAHGNNALFMSTALTETNELPPTDLYDAWAQLQSSHQHQPINKDDQFGDMYGIGDMYDPNCVPNPYIFCPGGQDNLLPPENQVDQDELVEVPDLSPQVPIDDESGSNKNTTYIIIGVVLGVALLLFIALVLLVLYCRKHEKACFRQRKTKNTGSRSGAQSTSNSGMEMTASTSPPPASTVSTSSYLPTQVEIEDPTLPPNWIALHDKNTNKIYYSNKVTMESSWEHPAKPTEKANANAYGW